MELSSPHLTLFNHGALLGFVGLFDRFCCLRKFVFVEWLGVIFNECVHIGLDIAKRLRILLGKVFGKVGSDCRLIPYVSLDPASTRMTHKATTLLH